jgi:hypothetical protein
MSEAYSFDSAGIEPSKPREGVIPKGWYRAHVVEASMKDAKTAGNKFAELEWSLLDGEHKGRKVWDRLNVVNDSEKAQDIARRDMAAICHATGVLKFRFLDELKYKPVEILVAVMPAKGEFPEKNEVKGYRSVQSNGEPPRQATRASVATPAVDDDDDDDSLPF